jgi:hypothetical protein
MSDRELLGHNMPFDSFDYMRHSCASNIQANLMWTRASSKDALQAQPYLAFRHLEVIRRTLDQTTQLARLSSATPMKRHVKALFPFLNRKRITETVATDTFFSSIRDISGATCAQVFYRLKSHFMNVYPLRTESDGPKAVEDFVRTEGIPNVIRSDNSKMQRLNQDLVAKFRRWMIRNEFTEPHHPQQNPAELRAIRWLKSNIRTLRTRTGATDKVWFWMAKYLVDIHNITADKTIGWTTPWSKRRGETPDISDFLQF